MSIKILVQMFLFFYSTFIPQFHHVNILDENDRIADDKFPTPKEIRQQLRETPSLEKVGEILYYVFGDSRARKLRYVFVFGKALRINNHFGEEPSVEEEKARSDNASFIEKISCLNVIKARKAADKI